MRKKSSTASSLDIAGTIAFVLDVNQCVQQASPALCKLLGISAAAMAGKDLIDNFAPEWAKEKLRIFFVKTITGRLDPVEYPFFPLRKADGREIALNLRSLVLKDARGEVIGTCHSGELAAEASSIRHEGLCTVKELQHFLDSVPDVLYKLDRRGHITYANKPAEIITGRRLEQIIGHSIFDFLDVENRQIASAHRERTLQGHSVEFKIRLSSGRILRLREQPLRDEKGVVVGTFGTARDITEREITEQILKESEEKYRVLVDMLPFAVTIYQQRCIVFANPAFPALFGYADPEAVMGLDIMVLFPERQKGLIESYVRMRDAGDLGVPEHYCAMCARVDGTEFPAEIFVKDILFQGKPARQVVVVDLSERQKADDVVQESEQRYRSFLDFVEDNVFLLDPKGFFVFANQAFREKVGLSGKELERLHFRAFLARPDWVRFRRRLERVLRAEDVGSEEFWCQCNGQRRRVEVVSQPVYQSGKRVGMQSIMRDTAGARADEAARAIGALSGSPDAGTKGEPIFSIREACKYLGVFHMTLRNWERRGKIKSFRTPGGHRRYRKSELDRIKEDK